MQTSPACLLPRLAAVSMLTCMFYCTCLLPRSAAVAILGETVHRRFQACCHVLHAAAIVYSRLQYGIIVWGTAHKYLLQEINLRLNKLIRICTSNTTFCRISPLYKNLKLLKLTDLYNFELAKFFYLLVHDELPSGIYENFTKIQQIHDHNTRRSKKIVYFVSRFSKSHLTQRH